MNMRKKQDSVNYPPHYKSHPSGIECIQVTEHMNFCLGYLKHDELNKFPYIEVGDTLSSGVKAKQSGYNIKITQFNKLQLKIV